jgi:transposase
MSLGRRQSERQREFWVSCEDLAATPRHVFYDRLNELLADGGFDDFVEELGAPFYAEKSGRPGVPLGVYFRMLFVGYFEGLDSQRGIAWRCDDSRSLRSFLGYAIHEKTPDHSSLTRIRQRLPDEVHQAVFTFVLQMAETHRLLSNKTVAVDATTLEANAAMKSIVRKDTRDDWQAYLTQLMRDEAVIEEEDEPTDAERRRFDKQRKSQGKKKVSNTDWESPHDPDARIMKMKDGRTHLAYKAEHTIDLESEFLLDATVYHADEADTKTLTRSLTSAQQTLDAAGVCRDIAEVAADKGYHANETLVACREWHLFGVRTYIPEPESPYERRWSDKPLGYEEAYRANRRRVQGDRGKRLQKKRSEVAERSFAHVCETGGARRTWLRGLTDVNKRYRITAAARNLGLILRQLFGFGKPRCLQGRSDVIQSGFGVAYFFQVASTALSGLWRRLTSPSFTNPRTRQRTTFCDQVA